MNRRNHDLWRQRQLNNLPAQQKPSLTGSDADSVGSVEPQCTNPICIHGGWLDNPPPGHLLSYQSGLGNDTAV